MREAVINVLGFYGMLLILASPPLVYAQSDAAPNPEWVVVVEDPRSSRSEGWQHGSYRGNRRYDDALELERFSNRMADIYNLKLKQHWFINSLSVYCLVVEFNSDEADTLIRLNKDEQVLWVQRSNDLQ